MDNMYIVYKTINIINNNFYIGVHFQKDNINDNYLGSGTLIKKAIKKYGRKNFIRETIREFELEQDAYDYERLVVNNTLVNNPSCYNLVEGGGSAFGGINSHHYGVRYNEEHKQKNSAAKKGNKFWQGRKHTKESIIKMRNTKRGKILSEEHKIKISNSGKGRKHTQESIQKMKENNTQRKTWFIKGYKFYSCNEASKFFNVCRQTILCWCKDDKNTVCYSKKDNIT